MSFRMPAEWEPHERSLMAWPTNPDWGRHLEGAREVYAGLGNAIVAFEPLTMLVNSNDVAGARHALATSVEIVEIPYETAWVRDSGPLIVIDDHGHRAGIDFRFNAWGGRYPPYDKAAASSAAVLRHLGIDRIESPMVLEGGAITVDGEGTLITTAQCLLNPNRNPGMSRHEIEDELRLRLGIKKVIWLPYGIVEDLVTDGHVDAVCTFARPGVVPVQTSDDAADPNHARMAANIEVLANATDAAGRSFEVIELPRMPGERLDDADVGIAYANIYVVNGAVIAGVGDFPSDSEALAVLRQAFPDREVIGIPATLFSYGGGGPHCTTMQAPSTGATQ